jgi:hypothetical protein
MVFGEACREFTGLGVSQWVAGWGIPHVGDLALVTPHAH